jgi:hypothetical protein
MRLVLILPLTCLLASAVTMSACSSEPAPEEVDPGLESDGGGQTLDGAANPDGNTQAPDYPTPKEGFGQQVGNVIKDYVFDGLMDPVSVSYVADDKTITKISLHQFYNPNKDPSRPRVLLMTWSALWCYYCKQQASSAMKEYAIWHPKGVEMMELVFEDNDSQPAQFTHLTTWTKTYKLGFPSVLDPGINSGIYFDKNAAPYNMFIDLSTMKITFATAGAIDAAAMEGEFTAVLGL